MGTTTTEIVADSNNNLIKEKALRKKLLELKKLSEDMLVLMEQWDREEIEYVRQDAIENFEFKRASFLREI